MTQKSPIDTIQMGYEETTRAAQSRSSRTSDAKQSEQVAVQDALSLAQLLQQLRSRRLDGGLNTEGA